MHKAPFFIRGSTSLESTQNGVDHNKNTFFNCEKSKNSLTGFTLVEILVSVAVIAILSTIVYMSVGAARDKTYDTQRKSDLAQLGIALKLYREDNGAYPAPGCGANWEAGEPNPAYSSPGPADPVGNWYVTECVDYIPGLAPGYIPELPLDPTSEYVNGEGYMYTSKASGNSYKLVVTRSNQRMIMPTEDFARCPSSCATCHGAPNTGEQAFAIYTPDMACE